MTSVQHITDEDLAHVTVDGDLVKFPIGSPKGRVSDEWAEIHWSNARALGMSLILKAELIQGQVSA